MVNKLMISHDFNPDWVPHACGLEQSKVSLVSNNNDNQKLILVYLYLYR